MINRPGDGPEDVDAAFAEIIADLEREGIGRDVEQRRADTVQEEPELPPAPPPPATASAWRGHETDFDWAGDDDPGGYEPPEPPPLPKLRPLTIIAIVLLVIGVVLLVLPNIIGLDPRIATPIALISLAGGIGFLLMRVRKTPPDFDEDDGAQV
ncbi:hypothetical protein [Actinokineospora xionganensis]|uniref:DUF308 domain-containing protein n=1 Tax=Actinokineospora xionganensis TaxID=2684470 RepID=A0ABR7LEI0_9PSEU|nr:hypothetical protein [Actinokineospora xionganensis]MBC6450801.1 hypothetical protein [Actinokineospora xionganensis]